MPLPPLRQYPVVQEKETPMTSTERAALAVAIEALGHYSMKDDCYAAKSALAEIDSLGSSGGREGMSDRKAILDQLRIHAPKWVGILRKEFKSLEAERDLWKERFHTADNLLTIEKSKAERLAEAARKNLHWAYNGADEVSGTKANDKAHAEVDELKEAIAEFEKK
jgi:hypothetical protein